MKTSLHTNYQTSFRIARENDQTFDKVIGTIYSWLSSKERDRKLTDGREFFINGSKWENCYRSGANISVWRDLDQHDEPMWTLDYTHRDKAEGVKRFWHTLVGLRQCAEDIIVSVRIAYSWNNEDLSAVREDPSPSVPFFVRRLLDDFTAFSAEKPFRLLTKPLELSAPGSGILAHQLVFAEQRRYPVIIFNGDTEIHKREAKRLATQLTGKAQVVVLASRPEIGDELKANFSRDWTVGYQRMRVYFPISRSKTRPERHRFFDVSEPAYEAQRDGILHGLLRNHSLRELNEIETLADLRRERARAALRKLKEFDGTEGSAEEISFLKELGQEQEALIGELEDKLASAQTDADHFALQHDEIEAELTKFKWQSEHAPSEQSSNFDPATELLTLPSSLKEVVDLAERSWGHKLSFSDSAKSSAKDSSECTLVKESWEILAHLATTLFDLKFKTDNPGDLAKRFQEASGYEYCKTEGGQTKKDASLSKLRVIEHEGKTYEIWPHIKKGNSAPKMIRIHFAFDEEQQRIIVGYVGLHMPNATTRKVG